LRQQLRNPKQKAPGVLFCGNAASNKWPAAVGA